jgi:sulfite reductase (NADPH) hemoprotein beta-component
MISDIIACPGLDYCSPANARSIPVAEECPPSGDPTSPTASTAAHQHFRCINACGHHHRSHRHPAEKNGENITSDRRRPRRRNAELEDLARPCHTVRLRT